MSNKTQSQKRNKLIQKVGAYLQSKGQDYIEVYFLANASYKVNLKVIGDQFKAFLNEENIRQIDEIDYSSVKQALVKEDDKRNLEYNQSLIQEAIESSEGIDLNPLCCGYLGPCNNPTRSTQRYNAYAALFVKTSDLKGLFAQNNLTPTKSFLSINDLVTLCWSLLKDDTFIAEVSPQEKEVMQSKKDILLEKKRLRNQLIQLIGEHLQAKGQSHITAYFLAVANYQVSLKVIGDQFKAFLNEENIRQINEIDYSSVKQALVKEDDKRNLEYNQSLIQEAIESSEGIDLNPLCCGYLGPCNNPTRSTQRYNAYAALFVKTSDLKGLFAQNNLTPTKSFLSINDLVTLCWSLLKDDTFIAEVSPQEKEVMQSKKDILLEKKRLRNQLIQLIGEHLQAKGQSHITAYFLAVANYQVSLKVIGDQFKAFLNEENIRQINEIDYSSVKQALVKEDDKRNLERNRVLIQQAIKNKVGVDLNPLCAGYLGSHKSPTRSTQRYNAYDNLFFKTSDLSELLAKNGLSYSKPYISINDLLILYWSLLKNGGIKLKKEADVAETMPQALLPTNNDEVNEQPAEALEAEPAKPVVDIHQPSELQLGVVEALRCVDFADVVGYFDALDPIVPARFLATYNQVRQQYILHGVSGEYFGRLKVFARSLLQG
ncbi:hypothetical protein [uncultured Microscilla sp.]|uniref:hypothetical protein n=1 Tax=uncultured Microscilla sp. TaxID=432653 RepID=UPI002634A80B|nr:hypothetical protein [uncultured Microscilla sp.]